MQKIDLDKTSTLKIGHLMKKEFGSLFSKNEIWNMKGNGIAGLKFYPNEEHLRPLNVNIEYQRKGLAIYLRNIAGNELLLLPFDEIDYINLIKLPDIIVKRKSLFYGLLSLGLPYYISKIFLLEKDTQSEYKAELIIKPIHLDPIRFEVSRRDPHEIARFIEKLPSEIEIHVALEDFILVER